MFALFEQHKKRLWEWVKRHAEGPHAKFWLGAVAFMEASFFPIPPGMMLIAILLANQARRWLFYSLFTALFSVLGGVFGYLIGFLFFGLVGEDIIAFYELGEEFAVIEQEFSTHAFLAILTAAFTPIPYKVFTIAAGVFHIHLVTFIIASALGRGIRYLLIGMVLRQFGTRIADLLYRYVNLVSVIAALAILALLFLFA